MANRRVTAPLHVTERIDYALKSVLLLPHSEGEYRPAKIVADHYGMSLKLLGSVLWCLKAAGIVDSRQGWHGGFRLAHLPEAIPLRAVFAAASGARPGAERHEGSVSAHRVRPPAPSGDRATDLVSGFWQSLDTMVQGALEAFSVADLASARGLDHRGVEVGVFHATGDLGSATDRAGGAPDEVGARTEDRLATTW